MFLFKIDSLTSEKAPVDSDLCSTYPVVWQKWNLLIAIVMYLTKFDIQDKTPISVLKSMTAEAIRLEKFEDAAILRDQIKQTNLCVESLITSKENSLRKAIASERFEDAAVLRDEIKALKQLKDPDNCSESTANTDALREELRKALAAEHFERAAEIRDQIRHAPSRNGAATVRDVCVRPLARHAAPRQSRMTPSRAAAAGRSGSAAGHRRLPPAAKPPLPPGTAARIPGRYRMHLAAQATATTLPPAAAASATAFTRQCVRPCSAPTPPRSVGRPPPSRRRRRRRHHNRCYAATQIGATPSQIGATLAPLSGPAPRCRCWNFRHFRRHIATYT